MDQNQNQQQPAQFNDYHHGVYNNLRDLMMQYHANGTPGLDKVIDSLNKQHTALMQGYMPQQQQETPKTVTGPTGNDMKSLTDMMTQIRQNAGAPMPSGYGNYSPQR